MNKEYVLITGGTGFIGSKVIDRLLMYNYYHIVAVVRKINNYKNVDNISHRGVILVEGNFYDQFLIEQIFTKYPIQYVIHLAAIRGEGKGDRKEYFLINVKGTEILLESSLKHRVKKFIFCSSVGVFGTIPKELPANINTTLKGDNDYHESKIKAEEKVCQFIQEGLNAFIVRPAITYGIGDTGFSCNLVKLLRKKILLLPTKDNKIHLLDVCKLSEIIIRLLKIDAIQNRTFIVADEDPIILRDLVDLIHNYYYKKRYPKILRLPICIFDFTLKFFQLIKNGKWCTRIKLLYKDWYYDTKEISIIINNNRLSDTKKNFLKYLDATN